MSNVVSMFKSQPEATRPENYHQYSRIANYVFLGELNYAIQLCDKINDDDLAQKLIALKAHSNRVYDEALHQGGMYWDGKIKWLGETEE